MIVGLALVVSAYLFLSFNWEMIAMCAAVFTVGVLIYLADAKRRRDPSQQVDPMEWRHDPVATRAGTAVLDSADFKAPARS